jgi:hypothetical protein
MKRHWELVIALALAAVGCSATGRGPVRAAGDAPAPSGRDAAPPRVPGGRAGLWDLEGLAMVRTRVKAGDAALAPAVERVVKSADRWLTVGPWSVVDKTRVPPSGDKHDYMSLATYWWPDPTRKDGVPYVRKDGNVNPERNTDAFDFVRLDNLSDAVMALGLAWYLGGDSRYADHAAAALRTWFLDGATRMNPNLEFAQGIPGITPGRAEGLIDTMRIARLLDAVELLRGAEAWTAADEAALKSWCTEFLGWLRTSKIARAEENAANNHGTWYDVQVSRYALFVGKPEIVKALAESARQRRIAAQIEPDGSQPKELARTNTLDYCLFNLRGLFNLASLAGAVGVDLYDYRTSDGRSIRKALDYMVPYADPARHWPGQQIVAPKHDDFMELLRRAGAVYGDHRYEDTLQAHFHDKVAADIIQLVYPAPGQARGIRP